MADRAYDEDFLPFLPQIPTLQDFSSPPMRCSSPAVPGSAQGRERVSGCTVHFVDGELDNGPIVVQRA